MKHFKKFLFIGIALEIIIFLISYSMSADLSETFKYSARFSGRLSLVIFLLATWQFARSSMSSKRDMNQTRSLTAVFALLHYIHLFLLIMNVKHNAITLIPYKLAGGALAYLMILLYPIYFNRIKNKKAIHMFYFLYVGFVMAVTYLARMSGKFEGADPELIHKIGLGLVIASMVFLIYKKIISTNSIKK